MQINITDDIGKIADSLGANNFEIEYCLKTAANFVARRANRQSVVLFTSKLSIAMETIRKRLKMFSARGAIRSRGRGKGGLKTFAKLWYGINPVDPFELTTPPVETGNGVMAGSHTFDNAFIAPGHGSQRLMVFKRKGKSRLPIQRQFVDVKNDAEKIIENEVFPSLEKDFLRKFNELLVREIERGRFR